MKKTLKAKRPILVTGSIRSGTTWVGMMLSKSPTVGYIHEPFNRWENQRRLGAYSAPVPHWFLYVTKDNESAYHGPMKETLAFRYNLFEGLKRSRSRKDIMRLIRDYKTFRSYRFHNVRPLVKDPFALFSAEWFAETFDTAVIVLIRHPAAIASSIKRLKWGSPFRHFLEQPLLMRDHLHPFEAKIKKLEVNRSDIIDQSVLLWNILYHVVDEYRKKHDDWIFLRHEDISRDPLLHFQDLFKRLDLDYSQQVERVIQKYSDPSNPSEVNLKGVYSLWRDSKSAIWSWKNRLTETEIERMREGTHDIAKGFYSDDDW